MHTRPAPWRQSGFQPLIMGILNLTPDSFSDGGHLSGPAAAASAALAMARAGAALIDVGGESTRPGAERVLAAEQSRRVVAPIRAIRAALDEGGFPEVAISIDTTRAEVATAALAAGATLLNDISGGLEDPAMLPLAAAAGAGLVLMHMQGEPATMQQTPMYGDVCAEVFGFLGARASAACAAGVAPADILLDPGIGFGKTTEHNLALLAGLPTLVAGRYPVLIGASRKRFIEAVSPHTGTSPVERLGGTCAVTVLAGLAGVRVIRVHDVAPNAQALAVALAIAAATPNKSKKF